MSDYNYGADFQKLFIDCFLSDHNLFTRCMSIVKAKYFLPRFQETVQFILDYSEEFHNVPDAAIVHAKTGYEHDKQTLSSQDHPYFLQEIETFCRHRDVSLKIMQAPDLIEEGKYEDVEQGLKEALLISLDKNIGSDFFTDFGPSLRSMQENNGTQSTGWTDLDNKLYGGFNRGELNVFLAKSGGGKSLIMQNVALNWAMQGLHVVYFSLELAEALINKRLASMLVGTPQTEIMKNIDDTALKVSMKGKSTQGSLMSKQMPQGSTTNDIRAYLKEYEIKQGYAPDAIIVDYLDLMYPNNKKVNPSDLFIKDKFVSEELRGLAIELKTLLVTASQVNREGMNELEFDFTHIAGGVSKINTSDNVIGILMTDAMRERGEMQIQLIKTRSSGNVGHKFYLSFDPATLAIGNKEGMDDSMTTTKTSSTNDMMDKLRNRGPLPGTAEAQASKEAPPPTQSSTTSTPTTSDAASKGMDLRARMLSRKK